MKKVVLFDIDYTLFDTRTFREKLYRAILRVSNQAIKDTSVIHDVYEEIIARFDYFKPSLFLKLVAKRLSFEDLSTLEKALWDKTNFQGNYYSEAIEVVEKLAKEMQVGIFSKGFNKKWQDMKIAGLLHLFDRKHIHITINKHTKLPKIIKKYKGKRLYLIDDALDVLHTAKTLDKNVFTVWVKRGYYADRQKPIPGFTPDATVKNLKEVIAIINQKN